MASRPIEGQPVFNWLVRVSSSSCKGTKRLLHINGSNAMIVACFKAVTYMSPLHCIINCEVFTLIFLPFFNHWLCNCNESKMLSVLCSSDGESTVLRFITVNKTQYLNFAYFFEIQWKILNFLFVHAAQVMHMMPNTFSGPLSSVPACMLPELHEVKVLFYAKSVAVVTSGHVTKMAVKSFDPPLPKTPCYTRSLRLYLLQNRSYCPLKFFCILGIGIFAYFCEKIMENVTFSI